MKVELSKKEIENIIDAIRYADRYNSKDNNPNRELDYAIIDKLKVYR